MANENNNCPKCNGDMVRGFIPDIGHNHSLHIGHWFEGLPEKSFWSGLKFKSSQRVPIGAFRCKKCGFLEFYANSKFALK